MKTKKKVSAAQLSWVNNSPYSTKFDDCYYHPDHGIAESEYVFLLGNNLPSRFADASFFCIGETGFGTGLNFLLSSALWLQQSATVGVLHYVSFEKHPLSAAQLASCHTIFQDSDLKTMAEELRIRWQSTTFGYQTLWFFEDKVCLHLVLDDIEAINQLHPAAPGVDAWFLDGFTPSNNPAMWTQALFGQMAKLSNTNATVATFSAAGKVRRGLVQAGFTVQRTQGFGKKKHMTSATKETQMVYKNREPWYPLYDGNTGPPVQHKRLQTTTASAYKDVIVVGAGIAGCCAARALARRGAKVLLLDQASHVAAGTSGNHHAMLQLQFSAENNPLAVWYATGFNRTLQWLYEIAPSLVPNGSIILPESDEHHKQLKAAVAWMGLENGAMSWVSPQEAKQKSGCFIPTTAALWIHQAGLVDIPLFCSVLTNHKNITFEGQQNVQKVQHKNGVWEVQSPLGKCTAPYVVCATEGLEQIAHPAYMPRVPVRGQITLLPPQPGDLPTTASLAGSVHATPPYKGGHGLGASYSRRNLSLATKAEDKEQQIRGVAAMLQLDPAPWLAKMAHFDSWVGIRSTTPDHMPYIGPVVAWEAYNHQFSDAQKGRHPFSYSTVEVLPNMYISCGLGSRGLCSAPLGADIIAALICREPLPVPANLVPFFHPARRLFRALRRGETL